MTSENEAQPQEQGDQQPDQGQPTPAAETADSSDPGIPDLVQAMQTQQETMARGFADLTSGLSQFLEKMGAVSAAKPSEPPASPKASESTPAKVEQAAAEPPAEDASESAPAAAPSPADPPQTAPAPAAPVTQQAQVPQGQAVAPPPVDPAAYGQTMPNAGFPQATPQGVPATGFPAHGQPQAVPATGFPVMQDQQPQAVPTPVQPVAAVQTHMPQAMAPQAEVATPARQNPIRAGFDRLRGKRAGAARQVSSPQQQEPQQPAVDDRWLRILFGSDLANNQALSVLRDKLLQGLLGGERNSTGLVGTILLFQSATSDRMPQILKDVGEAYYRWNPRSAMGEDPFRNALISWLHRKCESSGVSNTIEIVQPGDRFESSRHNSKQRGVEVTQVSGWVVLRDNGKVYTKATVAVK